MTTKTTSAAMTQGFWNKSWSPDDGDSGDTKDDQAIYEHLPDLGHLAVHRQHAGGGGGAPLSGQVEHPASVDQCPETRRRRR